ncbi:citrate transporter [Campylobacter sp. 2018MI13]|uniref:citrate transporter n=1 Tax=Campylobacter sp. 2018MI13 TaxID=2836737 RepID=UPI001BDA3128|nr:citrate transporter [Campylobacter sp. 2018MI13]MBT0882141.1 citrate transporter [Campylobacter sp. 2018MI13]
MNYIIVAQIIMSITLILMVIGKTPLYLTALIGTTISVLVAMLDIRELTLNKLLLSGLNPVILDMTGILMFIGTMQASGFMDDIIKLIIKIGRKIGGGEGIAAASAIGAGVIGMLTGFTQPSVTAVVTAKPSVLLGMNPNHSAAIHAHAGHLGNFGGFTHPTQVAIIGATNIGFGLINIFGIAIAVFLIICSAIRSKIYRKKYSISIDKDKLNQAIKELEEQKSKYNTFVVFLPFIALFAGFIFGYPIFLLGVFASVLTIILAKMNIFSAEKQMIDGVGKIAIPLVATITFLFMSVTIKEIGLAKIIADVFEPILKIAPVQAMFVVAVVAGFITQSYGASSAIVLPFLQATMSSCPYTFALALVAAGGASIAQYFLTGGPIAALSTVIPIVEGSNLKDANRFQRPSQLIALGLLLVLSFIIKF